MAVQQAGGISAKAQCLAASARRLRLASIRAELMPLAEDVPVRKGRETENSTKHEEQIDVEVHGNLLMRAVRAVRMGAWPEVKQTSQAGLEIENPGAFIQYPLVRLE